MAKKMNKYDLKHLSNLTTVQRQVDRVFNTAIQEAARLGVKIGEISPDRLFSFADYPITRKEIETLLDGLKTGLSGVIVNGVRSAWTLANNKNDELARQVFGDNVGKLSQAQYRRYFSTNGAALDAFLARKENGLNLSDRVWRYTEAFKNEIELGLDVGIRNGLSADEMSRELRQWLQHPDMLFRRVRDEHGQLKLSQRAAAFHPGRGVYRSSYKNARRLAATETNIAYRTSDHERWQQLDFVVGIRIVLSNNHTLLGSDGKPHPFTDICDELSAPLGSTNTRGQGCYPKDFKFTGWHPHCRCHAESILKTEEEMAADNARIMAGEDVSETSENTVTDVPQEFKDWAENNRERAANSFSVPYFVKDNLKYLPDGYADLYATKMPYDTPEQYKEALKFNQRNANFSDEIKANNRELSQVLPVVQGKIMNFTEADGSRCNPHYSDAKAGILGYYHNCQTCTMSYELRRRGFNVEAAPNPVAEGFKKYRDFDQFCSKKGLTWTQRWQTADGRTPSYNWSLGQVENNTIEAKQSFIEAKTSEKGRYEIYVAWNKSSAHVFTLERQTDGNLLWFDPQSGLKGDAQTFRSYLRRMKHDKIGVLRVDDKLINPKFAERLRRASK